MMIFKVGGYIHEQKRNVKHYFGYNEINLFINNINILVAGNGGKTIFAEKIKVNYDTVRSWCIGKYLPDGKSLLAIHEKFGVSIDWLLTGTDPTPVKVPAITEPHAQHKIEEAFMAQCPEENKIACRQLKEILLSDHPVIKPALLSNLAAFQYSIEKEKSQDEEIQKMSRRLKLLEDRHKAEQDTGIEEAASSSTGKRKT